MYQEKFSWNGQYESILLDLNISKKKVLFSAVHKLKEKNCLALDFSMTTFNIENVDTQVKEIEAKVSFK